MIDTLRHIYLALLGLIVLLFADAPFKTVGQKYVAQRSRERFILLTFEIDLVVFWAIGVFWFHWDRGLLPREFEGTRAPPGALVVLAGVMLATWAKLRLRRWFTGTFGVKEGHELVTDGPHGITRRPIYTGLLLMVLGAALVWDSALTLMLALLLVVPLFIHTVCEEALFGQHFGGAYTDYQRRVPRLVPFMRRGWRIGSRGARSAEARGRRGVDSAARRWWSGALRPGALPPLRRLAAGTHLQARFAGSA